MRRVITLAAAFLVYAPGAFADCTAAGYATLLTGPALTNAISGQKIDANSPEGENWKEIHCASTIGATGGVLQKVGVSPTDPVDPQRAVGTWSLSPSRGTVTYDYGTPATTYIWRVYSNGSGLCWQENSNGGKVIAIGTVGTVSCI